MHIKPEWIQAGLDEFYSLDGNMTSAIEKIAPLIRDAVLEEAAEVAAMAGRSPVGCGDGDTFFVGTSTDAARAIRALKTKKTTNDA